MMFAAVVCAFCHAETALRRLLIEVTQMSRDFGAPGWSGVQAVRDVAQKPAAATLPLRPITFCHFVLGEFCLADFVQKSAETGREPARLSIAHLT